MFGILIEYEFSGDEAEWKRAVDAFVENIDQDPRLSGRFSYQVNVRADGGGRIHVGGWDTAETLAHLQQQEFFKTFAGQIQSFAGDSLKATRFERAAVTASAD